MRRGVFSPLMLALSFVLVSVMPAQAGTQRAATGNPFGYVDSLVSSPSTPSLPTAANLATVSGWAVDPDRPATPLQVHVYDFGPDGAVRGTSWMSDVSRPDVAGVVPRAGRSQGFSAVVALSRTPGVHNVCIFAINTGVGDNTLLTCRQMTVPPDLPIGFVDSVRYNQEFHWLEFNGWAAGSDGRPVRPGTLLTWNQNPYQSQLFAQKTARTTDRPDVQAVFPGLPVDVGFAATARVYRGGQQTVCASALTLAGHGVIGCGSAYVPPVVGSIDTARIEGGALVITGWAADLGNTNSTVILRALAGTLTLGLATANLDRPDVDRVLGVGAAHGFESRLDISSIAGSGQQVCLLAGDSFIVDGFRCITV